MNIKNAKNWSHVPRLHAYLGSLAITMAAFGLRYMLHAHVEPYMPFQLFVVASLLTEYLLGFGPAMLSAALGMFLGLYFFIEPYRVMDGISRSDFIVTVNYAFVTLFAIGLIEYLQRTLYSNQLLLKVSQSRHKISLHRENDRLYLAKKTLAAVRSLERLFSEFDRVLLFMPADGVLYPQPLLFRLCGRTAAACDIDALALFHPDDRDTLKRELAQLVKGDGRRQLHLRLACGNSTSPTVKLGLERISVENIHATVLKLADTEDIASLVRTAASPIPAIG